MPNPASTSATAHKPSANSGGILVTKPYQAIAWVDAGLAASGWESDGARDSERAFPRN